MDKKTCWNRWQLCWNSPWNLLNNVDRCIHLQYLILLDCKELGFLPYMCVLANNTLSRNTLGHFYCCLGASFVDMTNITKFQCFSHIPVVIQDSSVAQWLHPLQLAKQVLKSTGVWDIGDSDLLKSKMQIFHHHNSIFSIAEKCFPGIKQAASLSVDYNGGNINMT